MNKKGYTVPELIVVLVVFGVIFFAAANKVSYAFAYDYEEELSKQVESSILSSAKIYATKNEELFKESKSIYLTVDDLVKSNLVMGNEKGEIIDPRTEEIMNDIKIKVTKKDDKITTKILK